MEKDVLIQVSSDTVVLLFSHLLERAASSSPVLHQLQEMAARTFDLRLISAQENVEASWPVEDQAFLLLLAAQTRPPPC